MGGNVVISIEPYERRFELRSSGPERLLLSVGELARLVPESGRRYRVERIAYYYAIHRGEPGAPLIAWHWDEARPQPPHIHTTVQDPRGRGARLHVPGGGRIAFGDVVRWLIEEWEVEPVVGDWRERLAEVEAD